MAYAKDHGNDIVILDTAGRLQIDDAADGRAGAHQAGMSRSTKRCWSWTPWPARTPSTWPRPSTRRSASDGVILTKTDGDTRGGAALSVLAVTGKPIYFQGTGEKLEDLEPFYPAPHGQPHPGHGRCALPD